LHRGETRKEGIEVKSKYIWAGLAIAAMWAAVAIVGVYGPVLDATSAEGEVANIPVLGIVVALFAMVGTILVAIFGFRE
jgi:hypothetical protein